MRIEMYNDSYKDCWEEFVQNANNGTIFQLQRFLSYHPPERFDHCHLMFYKRNKLLSVLPGVIITENGVKTFISHRGASYGGFIFGDSCGIANSLKLVSSFTQWCKRNQIQRVYITQPPSIYSNRPHNHIDFAFLKEGYIISKCELTSVIELKGSIEQNFSLFRPECRTSTRKALKGEPEVRITSDYSSFYPILEENLSLRHNVKPTHTLAELQLLTELFPEKILLFGCYLKDKMIAGVNIFVANNRTLLAFYISDNREYQHHRPVNLLFYRILEWGIERGYRYLDFGTYTLNMEPNLGLANFKEGFGALGLFRPTYTLNLQL